MIGGEETEVRLLAKHLDPARYHLEVVGCERRPGMPEQTHAQLRALGVPLDVTPYQLSSEQTIDYLAEKVAGYDLVVSFQALPEVLPALARAVRRPPLIEHGGVVQEASGTPKHLTARYIGVCAAIRDAAATLMPERPHHAIEIPSMVDLAEFDARSRIEVRAEWGVSENTPVIGWIGRFDRRKRLDDFIRAAAIVRQHRPETRFVVVGGPSAYTPDVPAQLQMLTRDLALEHAIAFLGERPDVPRLLAGFDVFVLLARGEGMPHVIAEAGAAGRATVVTRDHGTEQQIVDGVTGLFVPHESPADAAEALIRLIDDPPLRRRLGGNLRRKIEREYSVTAVVPRWEALFDEVIAEGRC
jgi:polysaccharide biosynthesis protein PelF